MSAETLGTLKNQRKLLELGYLSVSDSCTILQKYEMTNTLLEDSPIWATGGEFK
jgi:hypothetical protein